MARYLAEARGASVPPGRIFLTASTSVPAEGGWSAVLRVGRARGEEELALALLDEGVLVQPGCFFDFPSGAHLVVSLLAEEEAFARGAAALARVLG